MKRYVALVVRGRVGWTVLFPDFPGAEESGISLHVVLWKAQRLIGDRAVTLPTARGALQLVAVTNAPATAASPPISVGTGSC